MPKAERRGKYPGVKVHLDDKECKLLLGQYAYRKKNGLTQGVIDAALQFAKEVTKSIRELQTEHPDLLEERTPEQVKESLLKDQKKIVEQLSTMHSGKDWKSIK